MLIRSISLTNFRNHASYHLDCQPTTTLILGENGCGKTSVLEAIYILTQGKSFRATDKDILMRQADFYRIELEYDSGEKIAATYDGEAKTFKTTEKSSRRLPAKNKYPIILFLPSDLNMISGSPSSRRKYFDRFFATLSQEYASALNKYEKSLTQRNKLLKSDFLKPDAIFPWNLLLAKNGAMVQKLRGEFTREIMSLLTPTYHSIADNQDQIDLLYETELKDFTEDKYLNLLESNFEKDKILGHTTTGIHKDDFNFVFNGSPADGSASRGETRSIILALKFIEAKILNDTLRKKPIILLDDVFSELDNSRRAALTNNFANHQIILTSIEKFDQNDMN